MSKKEQTILELIKQRAQEIMPSGVQVFLYGSRARGDAHSGSDWDILILVNTPKASLDLYDTLAYPLTELGWDHDEVIVPVIYSRDEWDSPASIMFRRNVEKDAIALV